MLKKILLSSSVILVSVFYTLYVWNTPDNPAAIADFPGSTKKGMGWGNKVFAAQYRDGSYTGNPADSYYGIVQVLAIITGGKLADVEFLKYPDDRQTSLFISQQAMPILKTEAIQAQSEKVDIVSGATDTAVAFQESLGDALAQAKQ